LKSCRKFRKKTFVLIEILYPFSRVFSFSRFFILREFFSEKKGRNCSFDPEKPVFLVAIVKKLTRLEVLPPVVFRSSSNGKNNAGNRR